jgi:thiol:disulfide interchange protein
MLSPRPPKVNLLPPGNDDETVWGRIGWCATVTPMNAHSRFRFLLTGLLVLAAVAAHAQGLLLPPGPAPDEEPVAVSTAWSADRARPAGPILLAVVLDIRPGYHVIADQAQVRPMGDFKPFPTRVRVSDAPDGVLAEPARFPEAQPLRTEFADTPLMSFEGRTVVVVPLTLSLPAPAPAEVRLALAVEYQACAAAYCLMPERLVVAAALPVAPQGESVAPANPELFQAAQAAAAPRTPLRFDLFGASVEFDPASVPGLAAVLLLAAAGGCLLNLTPCVLPLVPVKIISLSQGTDRRRGRTLGLCTFAGVLLFWVGLGAVVSPASGFTSTHQLFQYPAFTIGVGATIALMAVGMCGAYAVRLPARVYAFNPRQDTAAGAVGMGVLTAVLSTPCTAPFMGTAAAWAATQAPAVTLATFAAIGAGMGMPYALLAARPDWLRRVPKTGPWSDLLKQVMGVFMLAAAAYFIGIGVQTLSAGAGADPRLLWWPVMGLCALGGVWMGARALRLVRTRAGRLAWGAAGTAVVLLAVAAAAGLTDSGPLRWAPYTPERFAAAVRDRRPVVMVFTAEWCLNCKALEQSVWKDRELAQTIADCGAVPMKVDLTAGNPAGRARLRESGSLTIPLLVVHGKTGEPALRSDFYTAAQVIAAVRAAAGP